VVFDAGGFYTNVEVNHIPNLAWDMEPLSDDAPDLVYVTGSTHLDASTWGAVVKTYLGDPGAYEPLSCPRSVPRVCSLL
jgi:hypothetical protein